MNLDLSNPIILITAGVILLLLLYLWNKRNQKNLKDRKQRSFKESYYERKKERENQVRDSDI